MTLFGKGKHKSIEVESRESVPVQVEEHRTEGLKVGFNLPLAQALVTAISVTLFVLSTVVSIRALDDLFWVGALVVGVTTILWYLIQATRWEYGVTILDVFIALGLSALTGWVCLCAHQVSEHLITDWPVSSTLWNLVISLSPVFFGALTVLLGLAFVQELVQRSPFQEQYIWKVISEILGQKYLKGDSSPRDPMVIHGTKPSAGPGDTTITPTERGDGYSPEQIQALDLRGFLTLGNQIGFSRTKMMHRTLPSGAEITDPSWRRDTGLLKDSGILINSGGTTKLAVSLREALIRVEVPSDE